MKKGIILVGGTSAIGSKVVEYLDVKGKKVTLVGRNIQRMEELSRHYQTLGASEVKILKDEDFQSMDGCRKAVLEGEGGTLVIAKGVLGEQDSLKDDIEKVKELFSVNTFSPAVWVESFARENKEGRVIFISSVAADRGRAGNHYYGASKGAMEIILEGMRQRYQGIKFHTVRPGFVISPMTSHITPNALFSSPEKAARSIVKQIGFGLETIYAPLFWFPVMTVIKLLPRFIFKKMKF